jgi:hypothetical protein
MIGLTVRTRLRHLEELKAESGFTENHSREGRFPMSCAGISQRLDEFHGGSRKAK